MDRYQLEQERQRLINDAMHELGQLHIDVANAVTAHNNAYSNEYYSSYAHDEGVTAKKIYEEFRELACKQFNVTLERFEEIREEGYVVHRKINDRWRIDHPHYFSIW